MEFSRCVCAGSRLLLVALLVLISVALHGARGEPAQAAPSGATAAPQKASPDGAAAPSNAPPADPSLQKSLTEKAIDRAKLLAKSASDIFNRVPCLPPKGDAASIGSLPHVAKKLAAGALDSSTDLRLAGPSRLFDEGVPVGVGDASEGMHRAIVDLITRSLPVTLEDMHLR